ncbi:MAG: DUF2726 domain-containing protein [Opitutaceae bacterium]|jgi:hypothetical protein|nr:DUF2726 domain-containing protein [Opitutaceae bacterium]
MVIYITGIAFLAATAAIVLSLKAMASARERGAAAADDPRPPFNLPYVLRRDFIPPPQRPFFAALREAVEGRLLVCPKPCVADMIAPCSSLAPVLQEAALERISRRHLDFLLVTQEDCAPVAVLEVEEGKQWHATRMEHDAMVYEALRGAGLAVFRIRAGTPPDSAALRELLAPVLAPDPAASLGVGTRTPFATMSMPLSSPPFASAPVRRVRTLVELQEERNRTRAPFPTKERSEANGG